MKVDHIAITVNNVKETVDWYLENLKADIVYQDETWGMVKVGETKIAFVLDNMHPPHLCFEIDESKKEELKVKYEKEFLFHRDGSEYIYVPDNNGNFIEFLYWPKVHSL